MPVLLTCLQCQKAFAVSPSQATRKFCSRKCMGLAAVRPRIQMNCRQCGKPFLLDKPGRISIAKYCSKECRSASLRISKEEKKRHIIEYQRRWALENPDKIRAKRLRMYYAHPEKERQRLYDWRSANRDHYLEYISLKQSQYYERDRKVVLQHYSGKEVPECYCCGIAIDDFLTVDHPEPKPEGIRKRGRALLRWIIKNDFPRGFLVSCFNCNCGREKNGGVCPHRSMEVVTIQ